mmetsp:Transcript_28663/g.58261  ORF Transcript_28663/g.58261 Transcript_28663/m.58261 type:complete len:174 (-) Transcript_28663:448-969(-)
MKQTKGGNQKKSAAADGTDSNANPKTKTKSTTPKSNTQPTTSAGALTTPQERAAFLEAKLIQVTAEASSITQEFMSMKEQLSRENAALIKKRDDLQSTVKLNQGTMTKLAGERIIHKTRVEQLEKKLVEVTAVIKSMQNQRYGLLSSTDRWEDCLNRAVEMDVQREVAIVPVE